jgi:hypothetical protein
MVELLKNEVDVTIENNSLILEKVAELIENGKFISIYLFLVLF